MSKTKTKLNKEQGEFLDKVSKQRFEYINLKNKKKKALEQVETLRAEEQRSGKEWEKMVKEAVEMEIPKRHLAIKCGVYPQNINQIINGNYIRE